MRALYIVLFLFIAIYSYAEIPESVCDRINNQSTDCKARANRPDIEDMKEELEYLEIQHRLELARQGKFEQAPIIINKPKEEVKITAYFEEE